MASVAVGAVVAAAARKREAKGLGYLERAPAVLAMLMRREEGWGRRRGRRVRVAWRVPW